MNADFFYTTAFGRGVLGLMQRMHIFRPVARFLHTKASKIMIPNYIKKNGIDMTPYGDRTYLSFADFFARKREDLTFDSNPCALTAPCDSLLSVYDITERLEIPMKGSLYTIPDLIPDRETAGLFGGGLCLVFRLEASDYHHFCYFDDIYSIETFFVPGQLHSVQPIALRHYPVFRLNRRWCSVLKTAHFDTAVQTEIGAMAVGGVTLAENSGIMRKGDEMGNFELAGSTIVLLLKKNVKDRLELFTEKADKEVRVRIGQTIGRLKNEDQT